MRRSAEQRRVLSQPIRPRTVLWESFSGNGALCNPEALFRYVLDAPEFADLTHTWVVSARGRARIVDEFTDHPRVSFITYGTSRYHRELETHQFLVNNATFPASFIKRPEQTYLNTWHGTPLKKMGYDQEGGAMDARNVLRNFMSADYLLSQSAFMTDQMYLSGYRLTNVFEGTILEEGYPRCDRMFGDDAGSAARTILSERNIQIGDRPVLVFAPTWRGESFYRPSADAARLKETMRRLRSTPALRDWVVLLKAHQVVVDQLVDDPEVAEYLIPNDVPANEALAIADLLVSDYSSIFVDFLATGRPIAFHVPDLDAYAEGRGLYVEPEQLPGPVSHTVDDLIDHVTRLIGDGGLGESYPAEATRYREMAHRLTSHEDGEVSARVASVVFGGRDPRNLTVRTAPSDGRVRLAIYLGGMITNGITSSAINLLNSLDPDIYDVTVLYYRPTNADRRRNAARIPSHIRQVIRDRGYLQHYLVGSTSALEETALTHTDASGVDAELWQWEWRRLFGDARFDAAIDFSGYSPYWARIMLHANAPTRSIWLHNDLTADALREVDGVRPHYKNLTGVFSLYRGFDHLVSVSPDLCRINRDNLAGFAPVSSFVSARNTIDVGRIVEGAGRVRSDVVAQPVSVSGDLETVISTLAAQYPLEEIVAEVSRQRITSDVLGAGERTLFVTVGRLSPEKNHARLLEAFAGVHMEDPDTGLVIIGTGPLERDLKQLAIALGISEAVTFTGVLSNPYAVMEHCDCFVLSSDYEGQPIVILEARVLGLPVITTRFGSAASAMEDSGGLIVECDVDALSDGMREFLAGRISARPFDGAAYNAEVIREFETAVLNDSGGAAASLEPAARPLQSAIGESVPSTP